MCLCVCVRECARGLALAHKLTQTLANTHTHSHTRTHSHSLTMALLTLLLLPLAGRRRRTRSHSQARPTAVTVSIFHRSSRVGSSVLCCPSPSAYTTPKNSPCVRVCACAFHLFWSRLDENAKPVTHARTTFTHTHTTDKKHREPLFVLVAYVCECVWLQRDDGYIIAATSRITRVDQ